MMAGGALIYYKLTKAIDTGLNGIHICNSCCYGIPTIIVGITHGGAFGNDEDCWLNGECVWAFLDPVGAVMLLNRVIPIAALKVS